MKKLLLVLLTLLIISPTLLSSVRASLLFYDSFLDSINPNWVVPSGFVNFSTSTNGITGINSSQWSVLEYPITQNINYEISLDLYINNPSSSHIWTFGIKDDKGNWKILNTWDWALQFREYTSLGERNIAYNWDRSLGKHHFIIRVSPNSNTKFEIIEDNKLLYSWETLSSFDIKALWIGISGNGDYEFSNFKLCDQDGCAESPTNTPTPTSTPYPTDAPTPTPTPIEPKKVVVIPGMGGSWNKDAFLKCKLDNYAGEWTPWLIDGRSPYQSLIDALKQNGYDPIPFYYDWRKPVFATAPKLKDFIQTNISPSDTVAIVGHSFGGLAARKYLEEETVNSRVSKLLTIGSPHQGAVLAYPSWSGGEMWVEDTQMRLGAALLQVGCLMTHQWSPQQTYQYLIPSFQNILPIFNYLKSDDNTYIPVASMNAKNDWLPTSLVSPFYGTKVGTITGFGYKTLQELHVRPQNKLEQKLGLWNDGKPVGEKVYADGDGTVLASSAQIEGAQNIAIPVDHLGLVANQTGIQTILDFLTGTPNLGKVQPLKAIEAKPTKSVSALLIVVDGAHAVLKNRNGKQYRDADGQITLVNPEESTYTLLVTPELKFKAKYSIIVVQLFQDGSTKWKSYERRDLFKKNFKLHFSTKNPTEDVLTDK